MEVLNACASLAVGITGITTLVGAIKANSERSTEVVNLQKLTQKELSNSMDTLAKTIRNQAVAIESMAGGLSHNCSRVGACVGEFTKIRKWLDWFSQKSLTDLHKKLMEQPEQSYHRYPFVYTVG